MIPLAPNPVLFLIPLLGMLAAALLLLWGLRLAFSAPARATLRRRWPSRGLLALALALLTAEWLRLEYQMTQIRQQFETEEAARHPTLSQPITAAGLAMPAGTRLVLMSRGAAGAQNMRPELFEQARFPSPVQWQGVPISAIQRRLEHITEPGGHQIRGYTWGSVTTTLASPQTINGWHCEGEVSWERYPPGQPDAWQTRPAHDAAQPAPTYWLRGCHISATRVPSAQGSLHVDLPAGSRIFPDRYTRPQHGIDHFWSGNDWGAALHTNWFAIDPDQAKLAIHLTQHTLLALSGQVHSSTAGCPLPPQTAVYWHHSTPNQLHAQPPRGSPASALPSHCGSLQVLPQAPLPPAAAP